MCYNVHHFVTEILILILEQSPRTVQIVACSVGMCSSVVDVKDVWWIFSILGSIFCTTHDIHRAVFMK